MKSSSSHAGVHIRLAVVRPQGIGLEKGDRIRGTQDGSRKAESDFIVVVVSYTRRKQCPRFLRTLALVEGTHTFNENIQLQSTRTYRRGSHPKEACHRPREDSAPATETIFELLCSQITGNIVWSDRVGDTKDGEGWPEPERGVSGKGTDGGRRQIVEGQRGTKRNRVRHIDGILFLFTA